MAKKPIQSPLPADLPTNWTPDQIVSPNGVEVGLTAQHGFNYLEQQVNAAQAGVNAINDAFTGLQGIDEKNKPNGYAGLDEEGKLPESIAPPMPPMPDMTAENVSLAPITGMTAEDVQAGIEELNNRMSTETKSDLLLVVGAPATADMSVGEITSIGQVAKNNGVINLADYGITPTDPTSLQSIMESIGLLQQNVKGAIQVFNGTTTWTPPPGVTKVDVSVGAGGEAGSNATAINAPGIAGRGGELVVELEYPVLPGVPIGVTVGSGGVPGGANRFGGDSAFGTIIARGENADSNVKHIFDDPSYWAYGGPGENGRTQDQSSNLDSNRPQLPGGGGAGGVGYMYGGSRYLNFGGQWGEDGLGGGGGGGGASYPPGGASGGNGLAQGGLGGRGVVVIRYGLVDNS